MPPNRQFALQAAVTLLVMSLAWPYYYLQDTPWRWDFLCLMIGATAFFAAHFSRQPWWWQIIHGSFAPLLWLGQQAAISPTWHLGAFIFLVLIFRGAASGQIPLYLSGRSTAKKLADLLPQQAKFLDIGAGIGSLLRPLGRLRPDLHLSGIENAPLPWLIGKLTLLRSGAIAWHWGDLWAHDLQPYDVVYCFLSPAPMAALWEKACTEMRPGTLFISKAFPIPGAQVEARHDGDTDTDTLYCYRIEKAS